MLTTAIPDNGLHMAYRT